ncbi:hypothetical protein F5X68DRAFT_233357 [Plectosphaerella plurivora]|uniref:Xylanolytic transcriptional activator regulatory domain-containing protein n=1 Tax=Plectosphaerella plurivora TaxID=936078 RepID=A0A9P8V9D4_9PEZI|nr:hypothetical protein F5X68DRAFT_233357 [Plectosphaerella plurivora]
MMPEPPGIFDSAWTDLCSMDNLLSSAEVDGRFAISSFQELGCQQHALPHTFDDLLDPLATYISPPADLNFVFPRPSMRSSGQIEAGAVAATRPVDWDGELEDLGHVERLSADSYETLALWVEMRGLTWAQGTDAPSAAGPPQLPPLKELNAYIQLYFEHFHDSFLIVHRPTFDPRTDPPLLVLVIANIGRRFSSLPSAGNVSNELDLSNFVHHAALSHVEDFESSETIPVWLAQAITLSQLGMYFTNSRPEIQKTLANRAILSALLPKIKRSLAAAASEHDECSDNQRHWKTWVHREALQRTASLTFGQLLDSQCCLFFDVTPVIHTELLQFALPCHENLWEKCSAESWKQQWTGTKKMPALREEMESLYRLTAVSEDIGAFSFLIILFGCFRDCLFLKQCEDMGLKALINMHGEPITWGGRHHPEKWRLLDPSLRSRSNDVNRITAQYYHMIRIVLHIPLKDLLAFSGCKVTLQEQQETRWRLMSWVSEHSDSAREVALHAGALFRQCRSHPTSGYQEPISVLIATIALWVYNSSLPNHIPQHKSTSWEQQRTPTFRLDNETDKDNITLWIRNGERMRPFIVGIGNMHASKGYAKVLRMGSNFLGRLQQWRISELFRSVFEDILVVLEL